MGITRVFKVDLRQAVRLPRRCHFDGKEVYITRIGDALVLLPKPGNWRALLFALKKHEPDFRIERDWLKTLRRRPLLARLLRTR